MQAETLNCPMCGAAATTDAVQCLFCSARLATVACPSCFGMMFKGSRHCPRCGAEAARDERPSTLQRRCPRCRVEMESVMVGATMLRECARCSGLWMDVASFEQVCAGREQQAAVLGSASFAPSRTVEAQAEVHVRYVPCPECGQLMNRVNFARCSGVVVDVCKGHGTWFDRDELRRIVEFIRAGGLDASRAREKAELAEERRRLQQEQLAVASHTSTLPGLSDDDRRGSIVAAALELLRIVRD
jgi:Zn-finger nucleic acid-binding protein